jgi:hypothetical protein
LRAELDAVYLECVRDQAAGAVRAGNGGSAFIATFLAKLPGGRRCGDASPETVLELFRACTVGTERIADEVGTDLFTAVTSQSLAVAVSAGQGQSSGLGPLRAALKLMRLPVLGAHLAAKALILRSATAAAVFAFVGAFGLTVLLAQAAGSWTPPAPISSAAQGLVVALLIAMMLHRWKRGALLATVVAILWGGLLHRTGALGWPDWTRETWRLLAVVLAGLLVLSALPWHALLRYFPKKRKTEPWKEPRRGLTQ